MTDRTNTSDTVPDGRATLAKGPRKSVPGLTAFILLILVMGLALIGWLVYNALHPAHAEPVAASKNPNTFTGLIAERKFSTTPSNAAQPAEPASAASDAGATQSTQQSNDGNGQNQPSPYELANIRRLGTQQSGSARTQAADTDIVAGDAPAKSGGPGLFAPSVHFVSLRFEREGSRRSMMRPRSGWFGGGGEVCASMMWALAWFGDSAERHIGGARCFAYPMGTRARSGVAARRSPSLNPFSGVAVTVRNLGALFHPTSVAVVGASPRPARNASTRLGTQQSGSARTQAADTDIVAGDAPAKSGGPGAPGGLMRASQSSDAFDRQTTASRPQPVKASMLEHPSFTIPSGVMIPCGTKTELDTTQPGMVSCMVSRDVYSADHKVKLIDKGAHVDGEIATGIKQGQNRVFVLWTRMRNPDNVIANLDSPGTNSLGSSGIPGQVNTHFWARFGSAMMISLFSDATQAGLQYAANRGNNNGSGNTYLNLDNTTSTSNQLASEALRATIDIPPTLYDQQGDMVNIYVRRDVDFNDVYGLSMEEPQQ
ncbi:type IV secretion system protein VirB10 [Burkholderia pseudomallei]|uniref:type IV secretion system protein VirB10 n=1 Tax=Burkholderia pseudomallei TaxID=28450 RepID=UPI000A7E1F26|nr:type IV secretion system protein VirB10 [Burkholderia pseudomallei]